MPTPHGLVRLVGSERRPLRGAARVADADPAESIAVTIRVRRRANGPPLPSLEELGKIPLDGAGSPHARNSLAATAQRQRISPPSRRSRRRMASRSRSKAPGNAPCP